MLDMVKSEAAKRGFANLRTTYAKAEALPFEDDELRSGHLPHRAASLRLDPEFHRRGASGAQAVGPFALVDNVVPPGSVGDYINAFERLRDPSHLRAWTMQEWRDAIKAAHLQITHEEQLYKTMEFKSWAARYDETMKALLRGMLTQVTPEVKDVLDPQGDGDEFTFRLSEGLFISKRA